MTNEDIDTTETVVTELAEEDLSQVNGGLLWELMRPSTNVIDARVVCSIWDYTPP